MQKKTSNRLKIHENVKYFSTSEWGLDKVAIVNKSGMFSVVHDINSAFFSLWTNLYLLDYYVFSSGRNEWLRT